MYMHLGRGPLFVITAVALAAGCGGESAVEPAEPAPTLADLRLPGPMRGYELITTTELAGTPPATSRQQGRWDASAVSGETTLTIEVGDATQRFAYRRITDRFWTGIEDPESGEMRWIEADSAVIGDDTLGTLLDGTTIAGSLLDAVLSAASPVTGDDGSNTWDVTFDGDVAGPVGASRNLVDRLDSAGFDGSAEVDVSGTLVADASGRLLSVTADLGPWWLAAYAELDIPIDEIAITVELHLSELDQPLTIDPPDVPGP